MRTARYALTTLILLHVGFAQAQVDTLRIATYNLLRFPFNNASGRIPHFRTVIGALQPDILVVQELQSEQGLLTFLNQVMNQVAPGVYQNAPFLNGFDTDNGMFYRHEKMSLLAVQRIRTSLRDITEFVIEAQGVPFRIYSVHLKAGSGPADENQRFNEATVLRNYLNALPANYNFIVAGDFNTYRSSELGFTRLTSSQADNDGRLFDPLNAVGNWNNNSTFARIHTQSTRTTLIDSGATGGMDDRFDMLLVSASLLAPGGMDLITSSYTPLGNDGRHFNDAVNTGTNTAVPAEVANALHLASDHLPVYAEFVIGTASAVENRAGSPPPSSFVLEQNRPNPFRAHTQIAYQIPQRAQISLVVYNLLGNKIRVLRHEAATAGRHEVTWDGANELGKRVPAGVYFYRLEAGKFLEVRKMIVL